MQNRMFQSLENKSVVLSGDGQMDSPGHSAKNCVYTLMEAESDYVIHLEVVDVRHCQLKSACMKRLQRRENAVLKDWVAAVRNHFWHCAKECNGSLKKMKRMWINLLKHVCNVHEWYGGKCSHGPLNESDHTWLEPDSPPLQALREIVLDKKFLKSFPFYTSFRHTGKLEAYHSHRLMYAPKRCGFSYQGTVARSLLAAIDHNHHLNREKARNAKGEIVFSPRWSKRAKRWKLVIVKEAKDYAYMPIYNVC
ncbi:Hypothetical predicted protein [Paramuricea clavata]|uniref:Uncharacterized protein n=1 Tax=Paramuricea clavata TaxID=317549 RepID=A0A6S7G9P5_PARCT|nr:Hypothetical predicted protein [Paramuricea clavata]